MPTIISISYYDFLVPDEKRYKELAQLLLSIQEVESSRGPGNRTVYFPVDNLTQYIADVSIKNVPESDVLKRRPLKAIAEHSTPANGTNIERPE